MEFVGRAKGGLTNIGLYVSIHSFIKFHVSRRCLDTPKSLRALKRTWTFDWCHCFSACPDCSYNFLVVILLPCLSICCQFSANLRAVTNTHKWGPHWKDRFKNSSTSSAPNEDPPVTLEALSKLRGASVAHLRRFDHGVCEGPESTIPDHRACHIQYPQFTFPSYTFITTNMGRETVPFYIICLEAGSASIFLLITQYIFFSNRKINQSIQIIFIFVLLLSFHLFYLFSFLQRRRQLNGTEKKR